MKDFREAAEKYVGQEPKVRFDESWHDWNIAIQSFLEGAEHGYSEAKKEAREWISVEDRLPAKDVEVLVTDGKRIYMDEWCDYYECPVEFSSATICVGEGWASNDFEKITHWMPLPEPPKSLASFTEQEQKELPFK